MSCDGRCCASFVLNDETVIRNLTGESRDDKFIARMLIPLTVEQAYSRLQDMYDAYPHWVRGVTPEQIVAYKYWHFYTCSHFDERTRKCMAYADRPDMCRSYPYDHECAGCGGKIGEDGCTTVKVSQITIDVKPLT